MKMRRADSPVRLLVSGEYSVQLRGDDARRGRGAEVHHAHGVIVAVRAAADAGHLEGGGEHVGPVPAVGDAAVEEAQNRFGETLHKNEHFGGCSDLSYLGFQGDPHDLDGLRVNLPGWGTLYDLPVDDLLKLDIPALNIGPSGKDAHKMTERLELGYSLNVAPKLLRFAVSALGAGCGKGGK